MMESTSFHGGATSTRSRGLSFGQGRGNERKALALSAGIFAIRSWGRIPWWKHRYGRHVGLSGSETTSPPPPPQERGVGCSSVSHTAETGCRLIQGSWQPVGAGEKGSRR